MSRQLHLCPCKFYDVLTVYQPMFQKLFRTLFFVLMHVRNYIRMFLLVINCSYVCIASYSFICELLQLYSYNNALSQVILVFL